MTDSSDADSHEQTDLEEILSKIEQPDSQRDQTNTTQPQHSADNTDNVEDNVNITDQTIQLLSEREQVLFRTQLSEFYSWMLTTGKDVENRDGLAVETAEKKLFRCEELFRFVWESDETRRLQLGPEQFDAFCEALKDDNIVQQSGEPYAPSSKRKRADAVKTYADFLTDQKNAPVWEKPHRFSTSHHRQPDEFTIDERRQLRETALRFDSLPSYSDVTPSQRGELKRYLSQAYGVPIKDVTPDFWHQHNRSFEIPSLICTTLDAGLRPSEIADANETWPRLGKQALYIPKGDAHKNRENWEVALRTDTVEILNRWLAEREHLDKYGRTELLWLTREQNPWGSDSLNNLLDRLCEQADINTTNRNIVWTSIRHSVGEHLTEEGNLSQAKEQLRHKSIESTLKYTNPSIENRQESLDRMG